MTETTTRTATAVDRYLAFWNTPDAAERDRLACDTFAREVEYVAPAARAEGCAAVLAFADELLSHVRSHRFEAREEPDVYDDRLRLRWRAVSPDGSEFATGTDVLHVRPDGLISAVSTFLDRAPDGFDADHH
jgi:ketosteroid isomerase-like protein